MCVLGRFIGCCCNFYDFVPSLSSLLLPNGIGQGSSRHFIDLFFGYLCILNVTCAHISVCAPQAGNKGASRVAILERQKQELEEKTVQMGEFHQQLRATEAELEQARYIFTIVWTFKTIWLLSLQRCTRNLLFF